MSTFAQLSARRQLNAPVVVCRTGSEQQIPHPPGEGSGFGMTRSLLLELETRVRDDKCCFTWNRLFGKMKKWKNGRAINLFHVEQTFSWRMTVKKFVSRETGFFGAVGVQKTLFHVKQNAFERVTDSNLQEIRMC